MEFYIDSIAWNDEDEFDKLIKEYPEILNHNAVIKEYQWDWGKEHVYTKKGLFVEFDSIDDLINFSKKIHRSLIINDNSHMYDMEHNQLNTIEIYDDWRE